MKACAITDHGVIYGAVEFYSEAKANGIHPIIGCKVYVAPRTRFDKVYIPVMDELRTRLDYELNTIKSMGFVEYFLIVWDFVRFARSHGVMVGPGRGSAAGSLVLYCMGITKVDPIKFTQNGIVPALHTCDKKCCLFHKDFY